MGPGGRGVSIAGPGSWDVVAGALAPLSEAAVAPAAVSDARAVVDAFVAALPVAALALEAELLADVVLDEGAEALAAAGLSVLTAGLATFFVVLPAAAVFFATFFWLVFLTTFFATFPAALFAAARMPPRTGPRASRSGFRAVSLTILSSVIARPPCRHPDATTPNRDPQRPGSNRRAVHAVRFKYHLGRQMNAPASPVSAILLFHGRRALSTFRRARLVERVRADTPAVHDIHGRWIYFVRSSDASERVVERLEYLLDASLVRCDAPRTELNTAIVVTPRAGTISPWSSKATDIARHCGLADVSRIERGLEWTVVPTGSGECEIAGTLAASGLLHDRMTQYASPAREFFAGGESPSAGMKAVFLDGTPPSHSTISLGTDARGALEHANASLGLALGPGEIDYLGARFRELGRDPTDAELMMFAQVNSEHCRHRIFNASWTIDGVELERSLFEMIRHTQACNPGEVLSAYRDNSAVVAGHAASWLVPDPVTGRYSAVPGQVEILMKVETHNHPTAISPFPGAATGSGGEIRDEAATGRGARSKAGVTGFSVSNLRMPGFVHSWERDRGRPSHMASALEIMLEGPIGAAAFNNEFGRPALGGYFRTFEFDAVKHDAGGGSDLEAGGSEADAGDDARRDGAAGDGHARSYGYHKPIMIAGGVGNIRTDQVHKSALAPGVRLVVLGGPAMLIGLGGGATSSIASGSGEERLDFASVQRENPEMQRRCQEVIDRCWHLGADNPILSIHDVGAGGLSNALPELVDGAERGGRFELRAVPCDDPGMSPLEIWCNESQERYVLAIDPGRMADFAALCERERCPWAEVGVATQDRMLVVHDAEFDSTPVAMPMPVLLGDLPRMHRDAVRMPPAREAFEIGRIAIGPALERVLRMPAVADKSFLVTIGDRTVGGLVARDQMVGPWQVPVADCAVTLSGFHGYTGEAVAMGERTPLALFDACSAARMAVAEALTNIAAADVASIDRVVLSANWMAACGEPGEDANLFDAVHAAAMELCPALGISIPVGKDSLSMCATWRDDAGAHKVVSPVSPIITAFAPVADARRSLVPMLRTDLGPSSLLLVDLGYGANRLGASALALSIERLGTAPPDLDRPEALPALFRALSRLRREGLAAAYHDRSDGGLVACVLEMAFAGRTGLDIDLALLGPDPIAALFCEEPGAVLQVRDADLGAVRAVFDSEPALRTCVHRIGGVDSGDRVRIRTGDRALHEASRTALHRMWSETSYRMQRLRDDPVCADEEYARIADENERGLWCTTTFDMDGVVESDQDIRTDAGAGTGADTGLDSGAAMPFVACARPRVAILREQGVNGHVEMAASFDAAGFDAFDVHMSDLASGRVSLAGFTGLAACGGFSFGDVLGAGGGWAHSIRFNPRCRDEFEAFFRRDDTFTLGVCNGCQMLERLRDLIPGAAVWPRFLRNRSEQFEARLVMTRIARSPSLFLAGMDGSELPTVVAHGEGRAVFDRDASEHAFRARLVCMQYVASDGSPAERYPANPNGSEAGVAGVTTPDGRVTIMMPHPERIIRTVQHSWHPPHWGEHGPWLQMFRNARRWVEEMAT